MTLNEVFDKHFQHLTSDLYHMCINGNSAQKVASRAVDIFVELSKDLCNPSVIDGYYFDKETGETVQIINGFVFDGHLNVTTVDNADRYRYISKEKIDDK